MKNFRITFSNGTHTFSMQVRNIIEAIESAMERNEGLTVTQAVEIE